MIFKITLQKKDIFEKTNSAVYETKVVTGRIVKTCKICKKIIPKGFVSTTHTRKQNSTSEIYSYHKKYITYHTCTFGCAEVFNNQKFTQ